MNFIKKIWDFIAKPFSKHFWRECWLETLFRHGRCYKSVKAETLEELCGYVNPSYSDLVDFAHQRDGRNHSLLQWLSQQESLRLFYANREAFLKQIHPLIIKPSGFSFPAVYEEIEKIYSFAPGSCAVENFISTVKGAGLEGRVVLSDDGKTISFTKIKVEGDVKLQLGGKFKHWEFDHVKFFNNVDIGIYPPTCTAGDTINSKGFIFRNNICGGEFTCSLVAVPNIHFSGNVFNDSVSVGETMSAEDIMAMPKNNLLHLWALSMAQSIYANGHARPLKFSNNYVEKSFFCWERPSYASISAVHFTDGNAIGDLSLRFPILPESYNPIIGKDGKPSISLEHGIGVLGSDTRFDIDEHIGMPSCKQKIREYKGYFVSLKNRAIEERDREAEFNYGRKERYFDRGLARWQGKIPLWWSYIVSSNGVSWARPAVILLGGQWILAAIFIGGFGGCGGWLIATVESLNPLSSLDDIVKSPCCEKWMDSLSASIYNAVRRIFSLALIYEIVKVLLRFSNKLSSG